MCARVLASVGKRKHARATYGWLMSGLGGVTAKGSMSPCASSVALLSASTQGKQPLIQANGDNTRVNERKKKKKKIKNQEDEEKCKEKRVKQ